jgi:ABC-type Fe3+ transport system substrate-binding protein
VDHLLSPEVEKRLAQGGGYQIPLNPAAEANLHPALARPEQVKVMSVDWERAADLWDETQMFLRDEFAR